MTTGAHSQPPPAFEYGFTFDVAVSLTSGEIANVARIHFRKPGQRGWSRFLLLGDQGETLWSLSQKIEAAIRTRAAEGLS